jgi:hypothetical protein
MILDTIYTGRPNDISYLGSNHLGLIIRDAFTIVKIIKGKKLVILKKAKLGNYVYSIEILKEQKRDEETLETSPSSSPKFLVLMKNFIEIWSLKSLKRISR